MELPSFDNYYLKSILDTDLNKFNSDAKLLEYFLKDAKDVESELNTKSYFLHEKNNQDPLVGFSISNNALEACSDIDMAILHNSQYNIYPAVLIGRFATHTKYTKKGLGSLTIDLIKNWFITDNKTGCRFIIVDSRKEAVNFYTKCGFEEYPEENKKTKQDTTLLYFDLKAYQSNIERQK